jgi:hypothetical protein
MDLFPSVEDQNKRKMQNVSIQNVSAVQRKRAVAQGVGGKPTNVKTFAKRKQAMMGGFMARRMGMR